MASILCVDDEPALLAVLEQVLLELGHEVTVSADPREALEILDRSTVDLIISDAVMPQLSGLELIRAVEERGLTTPVLILTGHSSVEGAVLAMRQGALDYLTKPVRRETLEIAIRNALEFDRLRRENRRFRSELSHVNTRRTFLGSTPAVRELLDLVGMVAPTSASVLIEGESGTGKELIARAIHDQSDRNPKPFVSINCAALPEGLVESVLFGHEKGAFTGATVRTMGAFERADGGTLLLDEISEMRLDLQAKLLRVIQEQEVERVGGRQPVRVDVRIVATTNRDLRAEADAGRFRQDLYFRLQVVPIRTPALRDRVEDVPLLLAHFLRAAGEKFGIPVGPVPEATLAALSAYRWPGNVRELANAAERAAILSRGQPLVLDFFRPFLAPDDGTREVRSAPPTAAISTAAAGEVSELRLDRLEADAIQRALQKTAGNRTKAAALLGISERTLRNKLNRPDGG